MYLPAAEARQGDLPIRHHQHRQASGRTSVDKEEPSVAALLSAQTARLRNGGQCVEHRDSERESQRGLGGGRSMGTGPFGFLNTLKIR